MFICNMSIQSVIKRKSVKICRWKLILIFQFFLKLRIQTEHFVGNSKLASRRKER